MPPSEILIIGNIEFLRIPAGSFLMGCTPDDPLLFYDEKPQQVLELPEFWMARFQITNKMYSIYAGKGMHPVYLWEETPDHPVMNVTWLNANDFCGWFTRQYIAELQTYNLKACLPTEAQWEKAARGTDGRNWPWGNSFEISKCNSSEGGRGYTLPVGSFSPEGDSPYGCAEMSGNVWEWTHSMKWAYPYRAEDGREREIDGAKHVIRGGSYDNESKFVRCAMRSGGDTKFHSITLGFRIALIDSNSSPLAN
jgi:toxoflavin biosynthesis protein ToxD